jgi:hypothetical protein
MLQKIMIEEWRMRAPARKGESCSSLIAKLREEYNIYLLIYVFKSKTILMRKNFLLFLFASLIALTFTSCKKSSTSNNSGSYYFNVKFDGTSKSFNTTVAAFKSNLGNGTYSLVITGVTPTEELGLSLWSDKDDFTAGKTFALDALGGTTYNEMAYVAPLGSSDPSSQWVSTYDYGTVPESFQCTITEATSTYIKGTVSGVIYQNNNATVASKTVTEGQFYAKF